MTKIFGSVYVVTDNTTVRIMEAGQVIECYFCTEKELAQVESATSIEEARSAINNALRSVIV
jgi:hypothetical protein